MPQDNSLVKRLKRSAEILRVYGCFTTDYSPTDTSLLLLEAAVAIQTLEGKLGSQDRPEGSTRGLMAT